MDQAGIARLKEHMRHHNRSVLLLTAFTFLISAGMWAGFYFVVWWLFLFFGSAVKSVDFHPAGTPVFRTFAAVAVLLCVLAWVSGRLRPSPAPQDHRSIGGHFLDLLLAVPRVTLSVFGTGGAAARLNDTELGHAWDLLRRMDESDRQIPIQSLPVDIPNPTMRNKILLTLQLSGLIQIRTTRTGTFLAFANPEAREVAQERVKLRF
jgi:hypothetical protein